MSSSNSPSNLPLKQNSQKVADGTAFAVIFAIGFSHLLNDTMQSLIPAIYPILKHTYQLTFTQVGLVAFTFQMCASLFQPLVGIFTDRKPQPFSLATGMGATLLGLVLLSFAPVFAWVLIAVACVGVGSAVFHPESAKVAYLAASKEKRGLAQSIFQVGGRAGSALGPLMAALVVVQLGQSHIFWFGLLALLAMVVLVFVGKWYRQNVHLVHAAKRQTVREGKVLLSKSRVVITVIILLLLVFSKYFYLASMTNYFTFYLISKFHVSIEVSQLYLFLFLLAVAFGVIAGGPLGDRFGRKYVIWFSILGVAPFTLALPHANLFWTAVLTVFIGLILSSAFPAILVYAQELLPGNLGMISGLFYGFAFGMGGLGAALLGILADRTSIFFVYAVCAWLPLMGIIAVFLPRIQGLEKRR